MTREQYALFLDGLIDGAIEDCLTFGEPAKNWFPSRGTENQALARAGLKRAHVTVGAWMEAIERARADLIRAEEEGRF